MVLNPENTWDGTILIFAGQSLFAGWNIQFGHLNIQFCQIEPPFSAASNPTKFPSQRKLPFAPKYKFLQQKPHEFQPIVRFLSDISISTHNNP